MSKENKKVKLFYITSIVIGLQFCHQLAYSQVKIGDPAISGSTRSPHASSMLEIESNNRGFLPPRISLTGNTMQLNGTTPADGNVIYNINSNSVSGLTGTGLYVWHDGKWNKLSERGSKRISLSANTTFTNSDLPSNTTVIIHNTATADITVTLPSGYSFSSTYLGNTVSEIKMPAGAIATLSVTVSTVDILSTNFLSSSYASAYAFTKLSADQSLATNTVLSIGGAPNVNNTISLDNNAFVLKAGRTYRLSAQGWLNSSSGAGVYSYIAWRKRGTTTELGARGLLLSANYGGNYSGNSTASALVKVGLTDERYELYVTSGATPSVVDVAGFFAEAQEVSQLPVNSSNPDRKNFWYLRLKATASQNLAVNVYTPLIWNSASQSLKPDGGTDMWTSGSNITIREDGLYDITVSHRVNQPSGTFSHVDLHNSRLGILAVGQGPNYDKNGASSDAIHNTSTTVLCQAGDVITARMWSSAIIPTVPTYDQCFITVTQRPTVNFGN